VNSLTTMAKGMTISPAPEKEVIVPVRGFKRLVHK
jgi:hypothetical protein